MNLFILWASLKENIKMVRISKQAERRGRYPRKHRNPAEKTGPIADNLSGGFKAHENAIEGDLAKMVFIPKIK
jgi:hypothetical protein